MSQKNNSRLYELIYLIKQEMSSVDLEKINNNIASLVASYGGRVIKQEYWGLRSLAYVIKKNTKAHYMFFGLDMPNNECITELNESIKHHPEIIRSLLERVKDVSKSPSAILRSAISVVNEAETVNVTIDNRLSNKTELDSSKASEPVVAKSE